MKDYLKNHWTDLTPLVMMIAFIAITLHGCGGASDTITFSTKTDHNITLPPDGNVEVDSGETVLLEGNQTIGFKPNTDVSIVNVGDGAYYISCESGSCPIHIGDTDSSDNSVIDNTDNSVIDNTDNSYIVDNSYVIDTNGS